jgi:hypothetical protein
MVDNTNVNAAPAQTPGWVNPDGLRVKFGRGEAELGVGGEFRTGRGNQRISEFYVDYSVVALGTDATHNVILDYDTVIPAGAYLEKAEFFVTEAWDSASNDVALNFGMLKIPDAGSTAYVIDDADGIMDTVAKTVIDLAGNLVVTQAAGSYPDITTYAGALMGTALATNNRVVSAFWENHVPTTGAGWLRLYWQYNLKVAL